ncbi:MAG: hypothetical protein Q8K37_05245 [Alphaproteobacteria bacterium]|nr:hypothetical protein [Alphaproteobacteria bacterium]
MKIGRFTLIIIILFISNFVHEVCFSNPPQGFLVTTLPRLSRLEIRLISQEPYEINHKTSDNKLWINFNNPIQADRIKGLIKEAPKWLQIVRQESPKTIYLEAKPNNTFLVDRLDRSIIITILQGKNPTSKITPEILIGKTPYRAELSLIWPKDLKPVLERIEDQLIFNVGQPINNPQLNDLWKTLPQWVTSSTAYYDSFVLKLAHDTKAQITYKGTHTILDFYYSPMTEKELEAKTLTPASPDIRLDRLKGQAVLNAERDFDARSKFSEVVDAAPDNLEAMQWLGNTEAHIKRWRKAIMVYDNMFSIDPQEYGVAFNKAFQYHEYGSYARLEPEWWHVEGGETQYIGRLSGRYLIGPSAQIDSVYEERFLTDAGLINRKGQLLDFEGSRRQGFTALTYNFDSMDKAQIGIYGQNSSIGGGAAYTIGWKHANTRIGANYHANDWNYVQQIANGGNVDNINLAHDQQFGERLYLDATGSLNRFNLRYKQNVASSIRANGALNYVIFEKNPTLSLGYAVIAEYKLKRKRTIAEDGTPYTILPIQTREAHILSSRIGSLLTDYIFGEAVGGYSVDRFGTHGPIMGLAFYYEPLPNFQFGIKGNREILNSRGSSAYVNSVGLSFTVRF